MPPRQKFTREEITNHALDIVKEKGIEGLTARSLGDALHTSSRPIFTAFENMEEVKQQVINKAKAVYDQYVMDGLAQADAFKGAGMGYIQFAVDEPKLFQLLFMSELKESKSLREVLSIVDRNHEEIRSSISPVLQLDEYQTERLYEHLWIYTHGIAALCATNVYLFQKAQLDELLDEAFLGILSRIKEER